MKMIGVLTRVLAQAAALVRTIYVVREEFAVAGRLAYRLAGLRGQRAIGKARRAAAAALVRHSRAASGELLVEVDVVIERVNILKSAQPCCAKYSLMPGNAGQKTKVFASGPPTRSISIFLDPATT